MCWQSPADGWDRLSTAGLQLSLERPLPFDLTGSIAPAFNRSGGKLAEDDRRSAFGWFIPAMVSRPLLSWLLAKASFGYGSIADYVDLDIPILYNQPECFTVTARLGADATIARRFRLAAFAAWERYDNGRGSIFFSLTASARL